MQEKVYENLGLIVAVGANREIGFQNRLIWRIKEDLDYFKRVTMDSHIIMGRKTYESMPKNLKGREYVVLSRDEQFLLESPKIVTRSISETLMLVEKMPKTKFWVIGGGAIYKGFLSNVSTMHITEIMDRAIQADAYFPEFNEDEWNILGEDRLLSLGKLQYKHLVLKRK